MSVTLLFPPQQEPVSLAEAKAHLRLSHNEEDLLINAYIAAARLHVEAHLARVLIAQRWRLNFDHIAAGKSLDLPLSPVLSIDAVRIHRQEGAAVTLPPEAYEADLDGLTPRFCLNEAPASVRSYGGFEIELTAGYGTGPYAVPAPLRQAILLIIAHWYEHREAASSIVRENVPFGAKTLIEPYRRIFL